MSIDIFKKNGKIIWKYLNPGYETRNDSTIWCVLQADKIYNWEDFDKINVNTCDSTTKDYQHAYSCYTGSIENLIPDFNFHCWPQVGLDDYNKDIEDIHNAGLIPPKTEKIGWHGCTGGLEVRENFKKIADSHKNLFRAVDNKKWNKTGKTKEVEGLYRKSDILKTYHYISMCDQVKNYKFLIDIEGRGYSGRLKFFLWSHRPVLLVDRLFKEYFYKDLIPWEHYIPVKRDLSDLIEKAEWCNENYEKALEIAEKAYEFSKQHLTREACYSRWNEIITRHINNNK